MKSYLKSAVVLGLGGIVVTLSLLHLLAGQSTIELVRPNPPPAGTNVTFALQLQSGSNGVIYVIQSSTNLVDWEPVMSGKSEPGVVIQVANVAATNHAQFFRARELPGDLMDTNPPTWTNGANGRFVITPPTAVSVCWDAAADDVGVANYLLYANGVLVTNVSALTLCYMFTVDLHQSMDIRIQAADALGNLSPVLSLVYLPGDEMAAISDDSGRVYLFNYIHTNALQANGGFTAARQVTKLSSNARGLALGDFDRDGSLDLVAAYADGNTLVPFLFKGRGDGTFAPQMALPQVTGVQNGYVMDMAVGDFDGDGNLDFVVNGNYPYAAFYWGNGDGTFAAEVKNWRDGNYNYGRGMAGGDFDEDGREDIARATYSSGMIKVFLSNGDRTFIETNLVASGLGNNDPYALAAGDFDEDGHLDLLVAGGSAGDVNFLQGFGNGTFTNLGVNGPWSNLKVNTHGGWDAFDYNADGHLDLVMAANNNQAYFWEGNGDGTFSSNRVTIATGLSGGAFGAAAPPRPPRVDVGIWPRDPVTNLNATVVFSAVGARVTSNDFFCWSFGDAVTNPVAWTFGTETNNMGPVVSHNYTNEGRFLTRLLHTATNGLKSVRGTWTIVNGTPPVAEPGGPYVFGSQVATQGVWYATLDGSGSTDDFGIVKYIWDFGDGTTATDSAPTAFHGWPSNGLYAVSLTVIDAAGQFNTKGTTITFTNGPAPVAVITGPSTVDETFAHNGTWTATFSAANSSSPVGIWQYAWRNLTTGQTVSGSSFQTTWTAVGTNVITLTVTANDSQTNITTFEVWVKANDLPVPVIQGPYLLNVGVATNGLWYGAWNATNSTDDTGIYVYNWNFGDGNTASGTLVTHQYGAQGVYPLKLTVTDHGRQSVVSTQNVIVVAGNAPVARITASTLSPEGAQPVSLSAASSSSDNGIYVYAWSFPLLSFNFAGEYLDPTLWRSVNTVQDEKLLVTGKNDWGISYFFSAGVPVQRPGALQGRVDTPSDTSHAMVGLKNLDASDGRYNRYVYALYFCDGEVRVYEYGHNRGQVTTYVKGTAYDFRVEAKPDKGARYYLRPSGTGDSFVKIFETSNYDDGSFRYGADVHSGVFGFDEFLVEGSTTPTRDFTGPVFRGGTVTLRVVDSGLLTNETSVVVAPVTGAPPVAVISGPTNGQAGVELSFNGYYSSDDYAIASYTWDFGDGSPVSFGPVVTHSYSTAGVYTNVLTVLDYAGQSSSATLVVEVISGNLLIAVPWRIINGIEQPHEVYTDKTNTLKAVARGVSVPFDYIWDYGDGSGSVTNTITNAAVVYNLETTHAYTGSEGTPFYATIRLLQTNGTVLADTYPIVLRPKTLDTEMKVAIDEGLWYLHKVQSLYDIDANNRGGYWVYRAYGTYYMNVSASAVQAFGINGHLMTGDASQDPYVETVQRGVNYLLTELTTVNIGPQTYGDPDGNANGIGLTSPYSRPPYEVGPVMDAFVAAGRPELVAPVGGANVKGRTFRELMQDMVDVHAWGQSDYTDSRGGGWRYSWNADSDNSVCQWAAIGCTAAERYWGLAVPDWVKERNKVWVAYSAGGSGFGYDGPGSGEATTPSGLVQLAWIGVLTTNSLWLHGENYVANNWSWLMGLNNVYANYAIAKALRSANPPVENLTASGKDWFRDPANGLARVTIDRQRTDGSWYGSGRGYDNDAQLASAWSVIILSSSLFQQGPVAVVSVAPNPSAIGYPVVFDARGSYHQHPAYKVAEYRWDFDASNGVDFDHPDALGVVVTNTYGALSTNTVSLQVRDNNTPQLSDVASTVVRTTTPPYPPTADAGGPYVACVGQGINLDGSGSFCVDAAAGNFIQSYDWETDFEMPLDYDDGLAGMRVVLPNGFPTSGQHRIGLRVKNANSLVYTNFALPDMTSDAFAIVHVYDRVIADLVGRPKGEKCQLTWTKAGDYAAVMRSRLGPDRGFEEIGRTDSPLATFLDTNIQYNVEYYYRVYAYVNDRPDPIGVSDAEFVVSFPRDFDERPPHFESTPLRVAQVGQLYAVTLDVKNPVNELLYYSVLVGPANLTVNPTNGAVRYVAGPEQVGGQPLSFQVTNAYGRDVLSYTLFVFPATNHLPVARANGPYSALIGETIQFSSAGSGDEDSDPLRFFWNFGDGTLSTNPSPTHAYAGIGDYLVTLYVNDGYGGTASSQTHASITRPNRAPTAILANGPHFIVRLGETLALDGSASYDLDGDPITFAWNWGDGSITNDATDTASHLFVATGHYNGALIVADNRNGSATNTFDVTVAPANRPPAIALSVSTNEPFVMSNLTLDASATTDPENDPMTFEWDFGDRTRTTGPLVTHMYRQLGDFTVTLKVSDNHGGGSVVTQAIRVLNAPPVFTSNPPLLARAGTNYAYTPTLTDVNDDTFTFQLVEGPLAMSCDTATGRLDWLPGTNNLGPNAIVLRATDAQGGSTDQSFSLVVTTPLGPQLDLEPTRIATTSVFVDSQTLALSGTVRVYLRNSGTDEVPVPFTVSVFVDADFDGAYATNADRVVGWGNFPAAFPAAAEAWVEMTVHGQALFKDCPLFAFVDSENAVPEYDESNNIRRSGFDANTNQPPVVDLSASSLEVGRTHLPTNALLTARLGNCGLVAVPTNLPMAFYDGDPKAGGALIGVAHSTLPLVPGTYQDLSVAWSSPTITTHTVFVVAADDGQGTNLFQEITLSNNSFSFGVDLSAVLPPVADAGLDQTVLLGDTVVLNGSGSQDPQGKSLGYQWSILSIPIGSQAHLAGANTASPSFQADIAGDYTVQLVVNNGLLDSTNGSNVKITAVDTNAVYPPTITSKPAFRGMVGVPYTYPVQATDPQGKPLSFRLPQGPAGMTINTNTGVVGWTPTNTGSFFVQVAADGVGGSAFQGYSLTIIAYTNLAPQFTSAPVLTALPNAPYSYTAVAVDPNLDTVTYALTQKPSAMAVNAQSGLITWTPTAGQMGGHSVTVTASDGHGGTATQTFNLVVMNPGVTVLPIPDQIVTAPDAFATVALDNYVRNPNYPASQIVWSVTGNSLLQVAIDSNRVATITYASGTLTSERLTFLATDPEGKSGYSSPLLTVRSTDNPPVAAIANLSADETTSIETGFFELRGTADDPDAIDPVAYRITLFDPVTGARFADVTPKPVNAAGWHEGRVPAGGSLGTLDFTLVRNGAYTLLLEVRGGTRTATAMADISLDSQLKVGQLKFSQQDLVLPIGGVNLQLVRSYDSLNEASGDFGYSWTYSISDLGLTINEQRVRTQDIFDGTTFSLRTGGSWDVTLDMPDTGRRVTFRCSVQAGGMLRGRAVWTPPAGVNARLVPTCSANIIKLWGLPPYWEAAGIDTALQNFDFPGFILTLQDGTQYRIDRKSEGYHYIDSNGNSYGNTVSAYSGAYLSRITTPDGERTDFLREGTAVKGIQHYDAQGRRLQSLLLQRDGENRIMAVYTPKQLDASGNPASPAAMTYEYDAVGNLAKVNQLADASDPGHPVYLTSTYTYGNPRFPHYITAATDARGLQVMRTEYDAQGRLIGSVDPYGNRKSVEYNNEARSTTSYDALGHATVTTFSDRGNILSITDPLGHTTRFTYDERGNQTSVIDALGHATVSTYDASGNKTSETDPLGYTTTYAYDSNGKLISRTDPLGHASTNAYDSQGRFLSTTDALNRKLEVLHEDGGTGMSLRDKRGVIVSRLLRDSSGLLTNTILAGRPERLFSHDASGRRTGDWYRWIDPTNTSNSRLVGYTNHYDEAGRLVRRDDSEGLVTTFIQDAVGQLLSTTDPLGRTTSHIYDALGREIQTTYPDGTAQQMIYDANGQLVLATDRHPGGKAGAATRTVYDAVGRVTMRARYDNVLVQIQANTNGPAVLFTSRLIASGTLLSSNLTVYDAAGRITTTVAENGGTRQQEYDAAGRVVAIVDELGHRTSWETDAAGRETVVHLPGGGQVFALQDAVGQVTSQIFPDGSSLRFTYDGAGKVLSRTDQAGHESQFEYDSGRRLSATVLPAVTDPENGGVVTRPRYTYGHDINGNLETISDAKGHVTRYTYDDKNRRVARLLPMGQTAFLAYNRFGLVERQTDFNGQCHEYLYDELGRVTNRLSFLSGASTPATQARVRYGPLGSPSEVEDGRGITRYVYDVLGRVTQISSPDGVVNYGYDPVTGATNRIWTSHSDVRYDFDSRGMLKTVEVIKRAGQTLPVPEVTTYAYTPAGTRASATLPNGVRSLYEYDQLSRLIRLSHLSTNGTLLASYAYRLALDGLRTGVTEVVRTSAGVFRTNQISYTFDSLKRLVRESATNSVENSGYDIRYVYDLVGNRLERKVFTGGRTLRTWYTYDANDRLLSESNAVFTGYVASSSKVPIRVWDADGRGHVVYRARPAAWCYYTVKSVPFVLVAAFLLPVAFLSTRMGRRFALFTISLCPHRALLPRCLAGFLAAVMALTSFDFRVLADEAALYSSLTTDTWGLDGAVSNYEYDANGSLTRKVTTGPKTETIEYQYDLDNRLTAFVNTTTKQSETTVTRVSYAYDAAGNRVRSESHIRVNGVETGSSTNCYLVALINPTGYAQVLEESAAPGAVPTVSYTMGYDLIAQTRNDGEADTKYYLCDGHGSTRQLADAAGLVSDTYAFDAFGCTLADGSKTANPPNALRLYCGEQYDKDLGQYYLRARTYDPGTGRFPTQDAYSGVPNQPQTLHRYAYCNNDPVNNVDPSGNVTLLQVVVGIAIVMILIASLATAFSGMRARAVEGAYMEEVMSAYGLYPFAPTWNTVLISDFYEEHGWFPAYEAARMINHFTHWYNLNRFKLQHWFGGALTWTGSWACVDHADQFASYLDERKNADPNLPIQKYFHLTKMGYDKTIDNTFIGWIPFPYHWVYSWDDMYMARHTFLIARARDGYDPKTDNGINFDSWLYYASAPDEPTYYGKPKYWVVDDKK